VARVEQTETPEMLKIRNSKQIGKKDKVVARELCSIMSKGTRTYCHLDDLTLLSDNALSANGSESCSLLICIKERLTKIVDANDSGNDTSTEVEMIPEYGVCCVDTILGTRAHSLSVRSFIRYYNLTGTIVLAQFQDDTIRTRLRTMISRYTPNEICYERNNFSPETKRVFKLLAPQALIEALGSDDMPQSGHDVLRTLKEKRYLRDLSDDTTKPSESLSQAPISPILNAVIAGLEDKSSDLVMCALGGAIWQLQRSLIDEEILSMNKFRAYIPPDQVKLLEIPSHSQSQGSHCDSGITSQESSHSNGQKESFLSFDDTHNDTDILDHDLPSTPSYQHSKESSTKCMVLDAVALNNLEILVNNFDHKETGSLYQFLNRCQTGFGSRLLKSWIVNPLYQPCDIQRRGAAIDELLFDHIEIIEKTKNLLKGSDDSTL
jgi:DNA mismatch repair protein MSH6